MNIVEFCRSPYGHGLNQSKLYRKLRQHVEQYVRKQPFPPSGPVDQNFYTDGYRVRENEKGELRYEIYDPTRFQVLAQALAGWQMPNPQEVLDLLEAARILVHLARHKHPTLQLMLRTAPGLLSTKEQQLINRVEQIVARALPK